jgi:phosphate transport system substrate-binding protein
MKINLSTLMSFSAYLSLMFVTFGSDLATADQSIRLDGSSTVFPISEAVAEEFQAANKGLRVTVGTSGTGGGFKKFAAGEIDITNASRPIKESEIKDAAKRNISFIELPVAIDGLAVVVHPSNTFVKQLSKDQLKKIWEPQSKITKWSDLDPSWPKEKITLFGPGPDSGTFDYFTEEVVGKARSMRTDYTSSEDDNVLIKGIAGSKFSLGYFGHGYFIANKSKVKGISIDNGQGAIEATDANIESGKYPLARRLYIYVSSESAKRKEVASFVEFYLKNVKTLAHETGYLPLPELVYRQASERFAARKTGSDHVK